MQSGRWLCVVSLAVVLMMACESDDGDPADTNQGNNSSLADIEPTFANVEAEIFAKSCTFSSCHGSTAAGDLNLTAPSFDRLVNVESSGAPGKILVIPGDADGSYLIQKLELANPAAGARMPLNGELEPDRIQFVRDWINDGAENN